MNITELYDMYKKGQLASKKIVFSSWQGDVGFEVKSEEEFSELLQQTKGEEWNIVEEAEFDDFLYYEYFATKKVSGYIAILKHPTGTNAYWKGLPDEWFGFFKAPSGYIYRFVCANYSGGIKEYVIECPPQIDDGILVFLKHHFPKFPALSKNRISLVFTNSSRFLDLQDKNILCYAIDSEEWGMKKGNIGNISKKVWNLMKESAGEILDSSN